MNEKFEEGYKEAFENETNDSYFQKGYILQHSDMQLDEILDLDDNQTKKLYKNIIDKKNKRFDW